MPPNNPMTEGEALAVLRELRELTWTCGMDSTHLVDHRETAALDAAIAALTAHTAASAVEGTQEKVMFYVLDGTWYDAADASPYVVRHGTPVYDENSIDTGARTSGSEAIKITLHVDRAGCEWFIVTSDEFPDRESEVTPSDDPALFGFLKTYTTPPAAVPADALERLVEKWQRDSVNERDYYADALRDCADELAALIPKGEQS